MVSFPQVPPPLRTLCTPLPSPIRTVYLRIVFVSRGSILPCEYFLTKVFHGEALLAPRLTPKLEDNPSSAVCDDLFNIFAATLHIGGRSSICNLRTRQSVVTGTHLSRLQLEQQKITKSQLICHQVTGVSWRNMPYKIEFLVTVFRIFQEISLPSPLPFVPLWVPCLTKPRSLLPIAGRAFHPVK